MSECSCAYVCVACVQTCQLVHDISTNTHAHIHMNTTHYCANMWPWGRVYVHISLRVRLKAELAREMIRYAAGVLWVNWRRERCKSVLCGCAHVYESRTEAVRSHRSSIFSARMCLKLGCANIWTAPYAKMKKNKYALILNSLIGRYIYFANTL